MDRLHKIKRKEVWSYTSSALCDGLFEFVAKNCVRKIGLPLCHVGFLQNVIFISNVLNQSCHCAPQSGR